VAGLRQTAHSHTCVSAIPTTHSNCWIPYRQYSSFAVRLGLRFIGILGGSVLCWLYVYLALPNINTNIAHNTFSVLLVALIGGYMGTAALDLVANKLGFPS
jgi:hypothetical protein